MVSGIAGWPYSARYDCTTTGCSFSTLRKEHPETGPLFIRAGCEDCGRITRQRAHGRAVQSPRAPERPHANLRSRPAVPDGGADQ